jgi:hypothetical protein
MQRWIPAFAGKARMLRLSADREGIERVWREFCFSGAGANIVVKSFLNGVFDGNYANVTDLGCNDGDANSGNFP